MQRYKDVRELRTIFEEFGPLADVNVPINQMNNQPRGFAFVEYKRSSYADAWVICSTFLMRGIESVL